MNVDKLFESIKKKEAWNRKKEPRENLVLYIRKTIDKGMDIGRIKTLARRLVIAHLEKHNLTVENLAENDKHRVYILGPKVNDLIVVSVRRDVAPKKRFTFRSCNDREWDEFFNKEICPRDRTGITKSYVKDEPEDSEVPHV